MTGHCWLFNINAAFKNFFSRSTEPDINIFAFIETVEFNSEATTERFYFNIIIAILIMVAYKSGGNNAGSAGIGFIFNAAFVGANNDLIVSGLFNEVNIYPFLFEVFAVPDLMSFFIYIQVHYIIDQLNIVRRARI